MTDDTFATIDVSETGTYYITVVAYNEALEPSTPVCSDGITIDTTPPQVQPIYISSHSYELSQFNQNIKRIEITRKRRITAQSTTKSPILDLGK